MRLSVHSTRPLDGEPVWKTVDQWYQTYWSGLDARFYAGNILLDELISLQWELQEAVMPAFGYADYTYKRSIHGVRRVQGAFTLNYKREGYLFELLRTLATDEGRDVTRKDIPAERLARTGTATLEDFIALASEGGGERPAETKTGQRLSLDRMSRQKLRQVAGAFEEAIWGKQTGPPNRLTQEQLGFAQGQRPRFQLERSFDLHIQFGSVAPEELTRRRQEARAGQGDPDPGVPVSTYLKLVGLDLTGRATQYDDSGRPIVETYTFIARDVL